MAECDVCGVEMQSGVSCSASELRVNGTTMRRIPYGREKLWGPSQPRVGSRCSDCGVKVDGFHHPGCSKEECMACGQQLFCCDCEKEEPQSNRPS